VQREGQERPQRMRVDHFRTVLGIAIGIVAGAVLWLAIILLIRALA
jgi:hypothetical protein